MGVLTTAALAGQPAPPAAASGGPSADDIINASLGGNRQAPAAPAAQAPAPNGAPVWRDPSTGDFFAGGQKILAGDTAGLRNLITGIAQSKVPDSQAPSSTWQPIDPGTLPAALQYYQQNQSAPMWRDAEAATGKLVNKLPVIGQDMLAGAANVEAKLHNTFTNPDTDAMSGQKFAQGTAIPTDIGSQWAAKNPAKPWHIADALASKADPENLTPQQRASLGPDATTFSKVENMGAQLTPFLMGGALATASGNPEAALGLFDSPLALAIGGTAGTAIGGTTAAAGAAMFAEGGHDQATQIAKEGLDQLSDSQLNQLPTVQGVLQAHPGMSTGQARQLLITEAGMSGTNIGLAIGALTEGVAFKFLPKVFVGKMADAGFNIPGAAVKGITGRLLRGGEAAVSNEALMQGQQAATGIAAKNITGVGDTSLSANIDKDPGDAAANLAIGFGMGSLKPAHGDMAPKNVGQSDVDAALANPKAVDPVQQDGDAAAHAAAMAQAGLTTHPDDLPKPLTPEDIQAAATNTPPGAPAPTGAPLDATTIQTASQTPAPQQGPGGNPVPPTPTTVQSLEAAIQMAKQEQAKHGTGSIVHRQLTQGIQRLETQLAQLKSQPAPDAAAAPAAPAAPAPVVDPNAPREPGMTPPPIPAAPGEISPEQAASQAKTEADRGTPIPEQAAPAAAPVPTPDTAPAVPAPVDAAPATDTALKRPDVGDVANTAPEPVADLKAQLAAVKSGEKLAVWIPASQREGTGTPNVPGLRRIVKPEGTLYTKDPVLAKAAKDAPFLDEDFLHKALGTDKSKADVVTHAAETGQPATTVRVTRGAKTLHEELTTPDRVDDIKKTLRTRFKGAKIAVVPPEQLLAERAAKVVAEKAAAPDTAPVVEDTPAPKTAAPAAAPVTGEKPKLPKELAGASPRYAFGPKQFTLTFVNDADKAAYIAANGSTQSKADGKYLAFAKQALGMTGDQVRAHGEAIRSYIKQHAAAAAQGGKINIVESARAQKARGMTPDAHDGILDNTDKLQPTRAPQVGTGKMITGNVEIVGDHPGLHQLGGMLSGWLDQFKAGGHGLLNGLRIMTFDDYAREYGVDRADLDGSGGFVGTRRAADGSLHQVLALDLPRDGKIGQYHVEVAAHELGHVIDNNMFEMLPDEDKAHIDAAYQRWVEMQAGKSEKQTTAGRNTPLRAVETSKIKDGVIPKDYALSRREWMADNIARWFLTDAKPVGVMEKFFHSVAQALKSLWSSLAMKQNLEPDATVAKYLADFTNNAKTARMVELAKSQPARMADAHSLAAEAETDDTDPKFVTVADGVKAGLGRAVRGSMNAMNDAAHLFTEPKKVWADIQGSRKAAQARRLSLAFQPTMFYAEKAEARGETTHPLYRAIGTLLDHADSNTSKLLAPIDVLYRRIGNHSPEARALLQTAMYEGTTHGVSLDKPWDHPFNQHLHSDDPRLDAAGKAVWERGRQRFEQLKALGVDKLYTHLRDYARALYGHTLDVHKRLIEEGDFGDEAKQDALAKIELSRKAMLQGDYFPKVRDGQFIVSARTPSVLSMTGDNDDHTFSTKEAADLERKRLKQLSPHADVQVAKTTGDAKTDEDGNPTPDKFEVRVTIPAVWMHRSVTESRNARPQMLEDLRDAWHRVGLGKEFDKQAAEKDMLGPLRQKTDWWNDQKEVPSGFLTKIRELQDGKKITPEAAEALRDMYLHSTVENSFMKSQMRDRNVLGASKDMLTGMAQRMTQNAFYVSRLEAKTELDKGWAKLLKAAQSDLDAGHVHAVTNANEFYHLMQTRAESNRDSVWNTVGGVLSDLTTIQTMGMSPAYIAMQIPQPWLTTHPLMAGRMGYAAAGKHLASAYDGVTKYYASRGAKEFVAGLRKAAGASSVYDPELENIDTMIKRVAKTPEEATALREWASSGKLDFNWNNNLRDASSGSNTLNNLQRMSLSFASQIEALNRVVSAIAAYRGGRAELGMSHEEALQYGGDIADMSQGNYRQTNKSSFLRGFSGKTVGKFKMWTLTMYHLFHTQVLRAIHNANPGDREQAIKTLAYMTAHHAAFAGLKGLGPMYATAQLMLWGLQHAGVMSGSVPNSQNNYKDPSVLIHDMWRSVGKDFVGEQNAERFARDIEHGPLTELGLDMSEKSGIPKLISGDYANWKHTDPTSLNLMKYVMAQLGPVATGPMNILGKIGDGNITGAVAQASPALLRDAYKAYELDSKNSPSGMKSIFAAGENATPWSTAMMALGLPSSQVTEAYEKRERVASTGDQLTAARTRLLQAYTDNPNDAEVQKRIARFNGSVDQPFQISNASLQRALHPRVSRGRAALQAEE